ncbi:MAG: hypothetical protein JWR38_2060 [Mucilaginibacter sp.]|nr:hypothetical protein [Mucilaginibacter sp.]
MDAKVYFVEEVIVLMLDYENDLMEGKKMKHPINVKDLIAWNESSSLSKETFEKWIDQYFEYVIHGADKSLYRVTGLLNIL